MYKLHKIGRFLTRSCQLWVLPCRACSTQAPSAALLCFPSCQCENEGLAVTSSMQFLENHGKNILLSNSRLTASRVSSYNQGIVVVAQPLPPQQLFQVCLVNLWPGQMPQIL